MEADARVALAEIKGDVKLILAGQDRTNRDVSEIRRTMETHNGRLNILEDDKAKRDGAIGALKWVWAAAGAMVTGAVAVIARALGV